jgi:ribosomal protein S18 acetylase RimI-like enzyme
MLAGGVDPPIWPRGTSLARFDPGRHACDLHGLFQVTYASGGGKVDAFDAWWGALRDDPEYDPAWVFLATEKSGRIIGGAQCWTSAFVKDLAVAEAWRRRGVGQALLLQVFHSFWRIGATCVDLKVESENPSGAEMLYRGLGMIEICEPGAQT